ncbi:MAG: ribosomal protein S18-alanine N-acetyltransferase [Magnetococcus sp. DMHC-1]
MIQSRAMTPDDLQAVAACAADLMPHPWSLAMLTEELQFGSLGRVLVADAGQVVGYLLLRPLLDEWHLMTIGVSHSCQRSGLGRRLLTEAIQHATTHHGRVLLLEVRVSNLPACRLYESMGFRTLHRRRNYYPAPPVAEDALVMELLL